MKIPEKLVPFLCILLLLAVFLLGRYQGQIEMLKKGASSQGAVQGVGSQTTPVPTQGQVKTTLSEAEWKKALTGYAASKGSESAPVTIVEFTDYQCPYCEQYFTDTYSQIDKEYIKAGKVRYLLHDLPLPMHPNAPAAAVAARCAGDQGKYWEMHDLLFKKQAEWSAADPTDKFLGYAGTLGLKSADFSACTKNGKYSAQVSASTSLAQELGVDGTPGFFVNGKLLIGAQPYANFRQAIEAAMK